MSFVDNNLSIKFVLKRNEKLTLPWQLLLYNADAPVDSDEWTGWIMKEWMDKPDEAEVTSVIRCVQKSLHFMIVYLANAQQQHIKIPVPRTYINLTYKEGGLLQIIEGDTK